MNKKKSIQAGFLFLSFLLKNLYKAHYQHFAKIRINKEGTSNRDAFLYSCTRMAHIICMSMRSRIRIRTAVSSFSGKRTIQAQRGRRPFTSAEGEKALRMSYKQRQLFLAKLIFQHLPFYRTFAYILQHAKDQREPRVPSRDEIVSIMKTCHLENIGSGGDPMYNRRAASVRHWFRWLLHLCKDLPADSDT